VDIALATANKFSEKSGNPVFIKFRVRNSARSGDSSPLRLIEAILNGRNPATITQDGMIHVKDDGHLVGEFNDDWVVNIDDFLLLTRHFGTREGGRNWDPIHNLNGDGRVGFSDFLIFSGISEKPLAEDLISIFLLDLQQAGATASALFVCPSGILFLRHTSIRPSTPEASMSFGPVPDVDEILKPDWKPDEYGLLHHFANFSRLANSVITEPGDLQGWFGEALRRHYFYALVDASVKCAPDGDGFIRATFSSQLPSIYFGRTGCQVFLDG
jgi:hypothetical protein